MERKSGISIWDLNVDSLFKIIVKKSIEICSYKVFEKDKNFVFDNTFYKQIDVVVMVSPLNPTLFNADLTHKERKWLDICSLEGK